MEPAVLLVSAARVLTRVEPVGYQDHVVGVLLGQPLKGVLDQRRPLHGGLEDSGVRAGHLGDVLGAELRRGDDREGDSAAREGACHHLGISQPPGGGACGARLRAQAAGGTADRGRELVRLSGADEDAVAGVGTGHGEVLAHLVGGQGETFQGAS
jgi:hypothetical protein